MADSLPAVPEAVLADAFREDNRFLWGLCYRMTGVAADADDIVQETFVRALERPPRDTRAPWRPWLVRVALNMARDQLRGRRRQRYLGPWLPAPFETGDEQSPAAHEVTLASGATTEGRYDLLESVSFAFLIALEALPPLQRGVLLLRDVFDYTVRETAEALDVSEVNVKTTHHRARRAMRDYDRSRCVPTRRRQEQTRRALEGLMMALANRDPKAMEALLAEDARALSDGGSEFAAARRPVVGRRRVIRLYLGLTQHRGITSATIRMLNGLPAVLVELDAGASRQARHLVTCCDVDASGKIAALYSVLTTRKLRVIAF